MHIISKLLARLIDWLAAVDEPAETNPSLVDWSDLPPHHPAAEQVPDVHMGFIARGQ